MVRHGWHWLGTGVPTVSWHWLGTGQAVTSDMLTRVTGYIPVVCVGFPKRDPHLPPDAPAESIAYNNLS